MTMSPAQKMINIAFIFVIVVLIAGALWYRNALNTPSTEPTTEDLFQQTSVQEVPDLEPVTLLMTPIADNEYKLSIEGLTQPVSSVTLIFTSDTQAIAASNISVESELENQGWSTAINSSTDSETGQEFTFSMLKISGDKTQTTESISIGTLTLNTDANELILDQEKSVVVYSDDRKSPINLMLGTATINEE